MEAEDRYLERLKLIESYLKDKYETKLVRKSEGIPLDVLASAYEDDYKGRNREIDFTHVPLAAELNFQKINMLQIFSALPFDLNLDYALDVSALLVSINDKLPLGNFGIGDDNKIYFRYVMTVNIDKSLDTEEFNEIMSVVTHLIDLFEEMIEVVANGEKDFITVMEELNAAYEE